MIQKTGARAAAKMDQACQLQWIFENENKDLLEVNWLNVESARGWQREEHSIDYTTTLCLSV